VVSDKAKEQVKGWEKEEEGGEAEELQESIEEEINCSPEQ